MRRIVAQVTLITSFLTKDFAVLASDRRVSWQEDGITVLTQDAENKAAVLCGHLLVGYTGFARLDGQRTDEWIVEKLSGVPYEQYLNVLAAGTEAAVRRMRLPLSRSGHLYGIVGFARMSGEESPLVPVGFEVGNVLGSPPGKWVPAQMFKIRPFVLPDAHDFVIATYPQQAASLMTKYVDLVARYRKRHPDRILGVVQLMIALIREAATDPASRNLISRAVSVAILPRSAVARLGIRVGSVRDPVTDITCFSVDEDATVPTVYGPAVVCPEQAFIPLEVRFGATDRIGPRTDPGPPPGVKGHRP